jgi:hypothetical protein
MTRSSTAGKSPRRHPGARLRNPIAFQDAPGVDEPRVGRRQAASSASSGPLRASHLRDRRRRRLRQGHETLARPHPRWRTSPLPAAADLPVLLRRGSARLRREARDRRTCEEES